MYIAVLVWDIGGLALMHRGVYSNSTMFGLMLITILLYVLLVLLTSVVPNRSRYSVFERTRRSKQGDKEIVWDVRREQTADDVAGVLRVLSALVLVVFILLALTAFGWLLGAFVAVAGVLLYGTCARLGPVHATAQHLYGKIEHSLLGFIVQHQAIFRFFRSVPSTATTEPYIASRDELLHIVDQLPALLTKDEQKLIHHGLAFSDVEVESVMTPRSVMDVVKQDDTLGPLLLDELHKTGHSRFPVIEEDVDHVVGILYIHTLLQLQDKKTYTASELMTTPVHYIKQDQTLDHALAAFINTHHHLFVVVNEYRETVGVLTLEDTIEALLGRKIVDEFDAHDDLRAVAARNPRGNNEPAKHTDV